MALALGKCQGQSCKVIGVTPECGLHECMLGLDDYIRAPGGSAGALVGLRRPRRAVFKLRRFYDFVGRGDFSHALPARWGCADSMLMNKNEGASSLSKFPTNFEVCSE